MSMAHKGVGFESKEEFMRWAEENKFKSWSAIKRYSLDKEYTKDNCYICVSNYTKSSRLETIEDETCENLRSIKVYLDNMASEMVKCEDRLTRLKGSTLVLKGDKEKLARYVQDTKESLWKCMKEIERIDIK